MFFARAPSSRVEASALKHVTAEGLRGPTPLLRIQSDERLVALTRRGNQAAYEALVGRYQSRLLAFCRHMLGSREDAEDVLQEVFAAAFNAMIADERALNVRPWLYRIARNRSLNHLRRVQAIGVDSMDVHLSENGTSAADKVHRREEFRLLVEDVQGLPETQRTALLLREIDALSYDQIAEAMETTIPQRQVAARARAGLAGRVGRGAPAHLRRGARRAGRGGRGPAPHDRARAPPPAPVRPLRRLPQAAAPDQPRAGRRLPGRAAAAAQEARLANLGTTASAGGSAAAAGAGAGAAGAGAGSALSAGVGAVASKAAAGLAAAAIVTAGAVEVDHAAKRRPVAQPRGRRGRRDGARVAARGRVPAAARRSAGVQRDRRQPQAADKPAKAKDAKGASKRDAAAAAGADAGKPAPAPAPRRAPAGLGAPTTLPAQSPGVVVNSAGPDQQASPPPAAGPGRAPPTRGRHHRAAAAPARRAARRRTGAAAARRRSAARGRRAAGRDPPPAGDPAP